MDIDNLSSTNHDNPPKEQKNIFLTDRKALKSETSSFIHNEITKLYQPLNKISAEPKIEDFITRFDYGLKCKIFLINILNYKKYNYENCFSILSQNSIIRQESDNSEKKLYITHNYDTIPTSFNEQYFSDQIEHYMNHNEITLSKFKGFSMTNDKSQFVPTVLTERPVNGPLSSLFDKRISLSNEQKYCLAYGIAKGMEYIHKLGFTHLNLNPDTIYLDENYYPKICDFAHIHQYEVITNYDDEDKIKYKFKTTEKPSIQKSFYMAPELFERNKEFDCSVDVFAYSMILYQIVTNKLPETADFQHEYPDSMKSQWRELIKKSSSNDISSRPSFETICEILLENEKELLPSEPSVETFLYLSDLNKKPKIINIIDELIPNIYQIDKQTQTIIRAAEKGHIESLEKVASYFLKGEHNLIQDSMHSYSCFKKAAELGSVNSMIETAKMIENGIGVEQSFLKASRIYKFVLEKMDENDPERSAVESKYKKAEEKSRIINIRVLSDHITLENIENNLNLPFHYEVNQIKQDENSFELKFNSQKEKSKSIKEIKKNKKIEICDHENKSSLFDLLNLSLPLLDGDEYYQGKDNLNYIKIKQTGDSEIYKVYKKSTDQICIAKVFRLENEDKISLFKKEINIMSQISSPSIIKYIGYCNFDITENKELRHSSPITKATVIYDAFTNLDQIIYQNNIKWDSTLKIKVMLGVAKAMSLLHKKKTCIYLRPENILLDEEHSPIVCDFGNSKTMQNDSSLFDYESSVYKAPELFITNPVYSEKTDVYSFGIIMYMILNEEFHKSRYKSNFCMPELLKLKMSNNYPDIPKNIPPIYADLIKRCCDVSIDSRPDFQTISNILIDANYSNNSTILK